VSALERASFGQRLRLERHRRHWTQEELAKQLNTTKLSVGRWEKDQAKPRQAQRREIYELFGKTEKNFGLFLPYVWNVPFERNLYFRGREEILSSLYAAFSKPDYATLSPQVLSGLGGIGKTHIAIEYAYRYVQEYDAVLWVRAESLELLTADFTSLANVLGLTLLANHPAPMQPVKEWLRTHSGWLLIFDNVEDIGLLSSFIPQPTLGAVLLTTRIQVHKKSFATLNVPVLSQAQSLFFLFNRIGVPAERIDALSPAELQAAESLCDLLDGLPLALDQAAAYINEYQCSIADYWSRFLSYRYELLNMRDPFSHDYPYSVATTWELSFERIRENNPASADLLTLLAFLHPDAIPIEFITKASTQLSSLIQRDLRSFAGPDGIIKPLLSFSLVSRDREAGTLSLHRLVQVVVRERMDKETYRYMTEMVVRVLNIMFPESALTSWLECERYLPHALVCIELIQTTSMISADAVNLLTRVGHYLMERTRYAEALPIFQLALTLCERLFGSEHLLTATALYYLAVVHANLSHQDMAEPLYMRALELQKNHLGMLHPVTARTLDGMADLYHPHEQSEKFRLEVFSIYEQLFGTDHPQTLETRNMLGVLYFHQKRYVEAAEIWNSLLVLRQQTAGMSHPDTARCLHNLGLLAAVHGDYQRARDLCLQSLAIFEEQLGQDHRMTATTLSNLAEIARDQGDWQEAETYWQRALSIRRKLLGLDHPDTRKVVNFLTELSARRANSEQLLSGSGKLPATSNDEHA
jgi:tetratricopeptide (TPR) repeat protein